MQESFLVIFFYGSKCETNVATKGNYFHFSTAMDVALSIRTENLRMESIDHGAYIYRLGLNKTYDTKSEEHCVFALRYHPVLGFTKTWFDENLKKAYFPAE